MANLSQLILPVKDTITGIVTTQTFDLAGGDSKNFIGSRAEWEALTQAEKEEYDTMDIYGEYNDDPIDPVPTSGSTNAVASGGVYTALQNVETNIAGIESSATASQAYTIGKYIIFGNVLYKVIASIAQGDTLVANTNIQAAKIADEVSDHLTVNGTEFYFDSHDGVFGYNTSPNRGADTFIPFSSGSAEIDFDNKVTLWSTGSLNGRGNISTTFSGEYDLYFAKVGSSGYIYLPVGTATHCAYADGGMWYGRTVVTVNQTAHTISATGCSTGGKDAGYGLVVYGVMYK